MPKTPRASLRFALAAGLLLACQTFTGGLPPGPSATPPPVSAAPSTPTAVVLPTTGPTAPPETFNLPADQQQRIFEDMWEVVRAEYLYPDYGGLDWETVRVETRERIAAGLSDQAFYALMSELVVNLGDDHSAFLTPEMVAAEEAAYAGNLDYVGVGVYIGPVAERGRGVIYMVIPGGPAEEAGLKSHDSILTVDGQPILDEEGYLTDSLLGPEGTQVVVEIKSPGQEPRLVTITRRRIAGRLPVPSEVLVSPGGQRIGYILIPTFSDGNIDAQVGEALRALAASGPLAGLILDNRINDGGFDSELRGTLGFFTRGLAGHFVNRQGRTPLRINPEDINGSLAVPLVVLVGPDTHSYGEIFAGVLADQGRATLIGETTGGNVETLYGYDFEDGSRLWLAHDTFQPINDSEADWEETGIQVDLTAPSAWDLTTQAEDPAILAALAFFDGE
ncbi:MAG: PDZ domain-containing protein [Chloroflexi bacterium]|nr:PDZ domain-containing protein [Chloroflexota bacterium]